MIEGLIVNTIKANSGITDLLSKYKSSPAVFDTVVPENVKNRYIVVEVRNFPVPDFVIDRFDIDIHIFGVSESRVKIREIARRIEYLFDPKTYQDPNGVYADIRFYRDHAGFEVGGDPKVIHYLKQLEARGSRKGWIDQL